MGKPLSWLFSLGSGDNDIPLGLIHILKASTVRILRCGDPSPRITRVIMLRSIRRNPGTYQVTFFLRIPSQQVCSQGT